MAKLNDDGSLDFSADDWQAPDPNAKKNQPKTADPNDPNSPENLAHANDIYGVGGVAQTKPDPTSTWNAPKESWNAPTQADPDADARAFIAKLAGMPGADPSLKNDPDYWVKAFSSRGGLNAGNMQYWQDAAVGPTAFFNNPNRESGGGGNAGGSTSAPTGGGGDISSFLMSLLTAGKGNSTDPARTSLMNRLNTLMDQYSQPVTADDPTIKASTDAYTGQVGRSVNKFKKTAAERSLAEGVPTGAFDSQIGNAEMSGGRSIGDFQTGMMRDEMLSRRNNLMATLQSAGSLLSSQDAVTLQNKIADIDATLKSRGLDLTDKNLNITDKLGTQGLDLQKLLGQGALSNQSTGLTNQNNQFYDNLGVNSANEGATLDNLITEYLLGRK